MYFDQARLKASSAARAHAQELLERRGFAVNTEKNLGLSANAATASPITGEIYAELDAITKKILTEPTSLVLFNDLMGLSKSVDIGSIVHESRRSSDSGTLAVDMTFDTAEMFDKAAFNYERTVIPGFRGGVSRQFRELAAMRTKGIDALTDDFENQLRTIRNGISNYFLRGSADAVYAGEVGKGLLNHDGVKEYKLKIDFTSSKTTGADMRDALLAVLHQKRTDSLITEPNTVYVSLEVDGQLDRKFIATDAASKTIREELLTLPQVKEIKPMAGLEGNQMLAGVLSEQHIRPLVGQEVSSFALPRMTPYAPFQLMIWGAVGLDIRTDYNGRGAWARIDK